MTIGIELPAFDINKLAQSLLGRSSSSNQVHGHDRHGHGGPGRSDEARGHRGDQVGAGKKSLAYSLTYQSDKTMTDAEAAAIRNKIVKRLEQQLGAKLRS